MELNAPWFFVVGWLDVCKLCLASGKIDSKQFRELRRSVVSELRDFVKVVGF
jgi:hypothetical protein